MGLEEKCWSARERSVRLFDIDRTMMDTHNFHRAIGAVSDAGMPGTQEERDGIGKEVNGHILGLWWTWNHQDRI
jgi:hypothetical protein